MTILIEALSSVTAASSTNDMLAARDVLEPQGYRSIDLTDASLETDEPNAASYTKTVWFELPVNPNSTKTYRVFVSSEEGNNVKATIYKQPSLDDVPDFSNLSPDDQQLADPMASEPSFAEMVAVQAAAADQVFEPDIDYASSYFIQVGVTSGTGDEVVLVWADATPALGGTYGNPFLATGFAGSASISTTNAWLEDGEPNSSGITEIRSVWLKWNAPDSISTDMNFTISGDGSTPFSAEIYTIPDDWDGQEVPTFTSITSELSSTGETVFLSTTPDGDSVYYVRVATAADGKTFRIGWTVPVIEQPAAEPVQSILVTVHAGAGGGSWGGLTYAANEMITELPNRLGVQFQENLNTPGSGSLTMLQNDVLIRAFNPANWPLEDNDSWDTTTQATWSEDPFQLLRFGNIIKFWMYNSGTEETKCISAFIIKNRETNVVGSGEAADRTITVSGPTVHALLADFMIVHDNYPGSRPYDYRVYNWASPIRHGDLWEEGGWFDKTGTYITNKFAWNNPINGAEFTKPPGYSKKYGESYKSRPKYALVKRKNPKWPDPKANWLWMTSTPSRNNDKNFPPAGKHASGIHAYKSKEFWVREAGNYRFSISCDTEWKVYLDGYLFMSGDGNENYASWRYKTVKLTTSSVDAPHHVAIFVQETLDGKGDDHNDAFIFTCQLLNSKGAVVKSILRSTKSTWYAWHGSTSPGWSYAAILESVVRDAKRRGNDSANMLQLRTDFAHKSEEGADWYDTKKRHVSFQVGTSALDLAAKMSETNRMDIWVDPDTLELKAWQGGTNGEYPRGLDRSKNVALVPGYNLLNWSVTETDEVKNKLLVQYDGGFVNVSADTDSGNYESIARYGEREGYLELGGLNDVNAAIDTAKSILTFTASPDTVAGSSDVVGHFSESYNGSVIPRRGAVPFLDFEVGDTISAPAANSVLRPHRVLSITCTEDSNGTLTFDPELQGV